MFENPSVDVSDKPRHMTDQNMLIISLEYTPKSHTAVTLKHNQGHGKCYKWAKLSEYYHHAKFDIYHIYEHLAGWPACLPNADHYTLTFFM